jgi:glycosylphosphatidylinositol transamidase (GPIT) subunit GPI8/ABC-type branched-subunit amino acid transport system substrate-binding protein
MKRQTNRCRQGILLASFLLLMLGIMGSCRKGDDVIVHVTKVQTVSYKIAVVLPIGSEGEYKARLDSTVNWALENMRLAQKVLIAQGDSMTVDLDIEWYDEDNVDLKTLSAELARRDDILLVVGPLRNSNVDIMASACSATGKTLIVPYATSENIIRRYSVGTAGVKNKNPFLWSLCETDVSQCEALMAKAWEGGAKTISLLSPNDDYGQTYFDWIPFQANEMGMNLTVNAQYSSGNLSEQAMQVLGSGVDCAICAVRTADEARAVLEAKQKLGEKAPRVLFSNGALSASLLNFGDLAEGAEGVAPYADPSTGFEVAYEERFGMSPAGAESQVYDAILLAGFTAFVRNYMECGDDYTQDEMNPNEIISQMTSLEGNPYPVWNELGLRTLLMLLKNGMYVTMKGASGELTFDSESYTSLLQSTYVHWMIYEGNILTIDYTSSDGSNRVTPTLASWNWQAKNMETIVDQNVDISYKPLKDQWAVLVQGSKGWRNYRHQADVLNMYQLLKSKGWDDDHIILIMANDIVDNASNKYFGEVRAYSDGDNLYQDVQLDYDTDTMSVADINEIFMGRQSQHLPVVLPSTDETNVLFFWSGHGCLEDLNHKTDGFNWGSSSVFSTKMLKQMLTQMHDEGRYRKMLLLFEPCYSENMIDQSEGLPGILSFASASSNEQSFADYHSSTLSVWMSDRFSNNVVKQMKENSQQTYKDLYVYLAEHTLGSHVHVANASCFGNLYTNTPSEFFDIKK